MASLATGYWAYILMKLNFVISHIHRVALLGIKMINIRRCNVCSCSALNSHMGFIYTCSCFVWFYTFSGFSYLFILFTHFLSLSISLSLAHSQHIHTTARSFSHKYSRLMSWGSAFIFPNKCKHHLVLFPWTQYFMWTMCGKDVLKSYRYWNNRV